jgi:hypothetical protein
VGKGVKVAHVLEVVVGRETNAYAASPISSVVGSMSSRTAGAVSNGVKLLVCPDFGVIMEELFEDVSFAPDGSAVTQPDAQ